MKKKESKILILVVNYNLSIKESKTLINLKNNKNLILDNWTIFCWDNLPLNSNLKIFKQEFEGIKKVYIGSKKNESLMNIYNNAIEKYKDEYDYLILLDNDTDITEDYLNEIKDLVNQNTKLNLILPKIINQNIVYSPQLSFPTKIKRRKFFDKEEYGLKSSKDIFAINSGMVIATDYLKKTNFKYDERLKFYGTDNYFINNYEKNEEQFYMMKTIINHSFSMHEKEQLEKILWRFEDYLNGSMVMLEKYKKIEKLIFLLKLIKMTIIKTKEHKTLKFLLILIKKLKVK